MSIMDRRKVEKMFFEGIKQKDISENSEWYVVDINWSRRWYAFISDSSSVPGRINNNNLYKKYYVYSQKIQL